MVGKVVGRHPEIKVLGLGMTDPQTKEFVTMNFTGTKTKTR